MLADGFGTASGCLQHDNDVMQPPRQGDSDAQHLPQADDGLGAWVRRHARLTEIATPTALFTISGATAQLLGVTGYDIVLSVLIATASGALFARALQLPSPKGLVAVVSCLLLVVTSFGYILLKAAPNRSAHQPAAGPGSPSTAGPGSSPSAQSSSPSSSDAPAPTASLDATSQAIQWTGTVRIAEAGPKLDSVPAAEGDQLEADVTLGLVDPPRIYGEDGSINPTNLALWPGPGMPDRQQCSDLISTQGIRHIEVKTGTVVCVKTHAGRIAVLTIKSTTNSFSTGEMAQASVWSQVSDQN